MTNNPMDANVNPYESPAAETVVGPPGAHPTGGVLRSFAKWSIICSISAAPSFFWGFSVHQEISRIASAGMISGIAVFIVAYSLVECTRFYKRLHDVPLLMRAIKIGYWTRIMMSIIFPVALFLDMFTGMISLSLTQSLFAEPSFWSVFATTLLQGTLLNILLFGYMGVLYTVQILWIRLFSKSPNVVPVSQAP